MTISNVVAFDCFAIGYIKYFFDTNINSIFYSFIQFVSSYQKFRYRFSENTDMLEGEGVEESFKCGMREIGYFERILMYHNYIYTQKLCWYHSRIQGQQRDRAYNFVWWRRCENDVSNNINFLHLLLFSHLLLIIHLSYFKFSVNMSKYCFSSKKVNRLALKSLIEKCIENNFSSFHISFLSTNEC